MARQALFTPEEDRILKRLAGKPIAEVNAALKKAGFKERSSEQVRARRYYITHDAPEAKASVQDPVLDLTMQRNRIMRQLERTQASLTQLQADLEEVTKELQKAVKTI